MCHLQQVCAGGLRVEYAVIETTMVHVFVALRGNNDWRQVSQTLQYDTHGVWHTIYAHSDDPYNFVAISCYDSQHGARVAVDAISAGYKH
ncbi:MAG: hypothetical protein LBC03_04865 [Nitrososphaerota archaeon]|jgi:hypothetical protein|nr:hypothetical protein [Nitrososphaerota archaeon]